MKNVLFFGGGGLIAHVAKKYLTERGGYTIFSPSSREVDVLHAGQLAEYVQSKQIDIVLQSLQFPGYPVERPWLGDKYTFAGTDLQGTRNILQALKQADKQPEQYVYISGAMNPEADYAWTDAKQAAEQAIQDSGYAHTILRPSWVYGTGDRSMSKFVFFAKYMPIFPVIGDGQAQINPVWVEDLGQIISKAIDNPQTYGQTINVGGPTMNIDQIAQVLFELLGKNKMILHHPKWLMKILGLFAQFIPGSPLSPGSVDFISMHAPIDNPPEELLGVRIHDLASGLKASGMLN